MLKIYFVFLLVSVIGLLFSLFFDGDNDANVTDGLDGEHPDGFSHGDIQDSPKVFSMRVIFSFLLAFAIGGGAIFYHGGDILKQILVGLTAGVLTGAFTWGLTAILYKMQGSSSVSSDNFIGMSGDIVIGTTEAGKAKVRIITNSGPMEFLCKEFNDKKLKNGDLVSITGKMGHLLLVGKLIKPKVKKQIQVYIYKQLNN